MSDVNKLDSKQCPFDPNEYEYKKQIDIKVDNVAPVGSLPWAFIQVYVGKLVRRSGWDTSVKYIKLLSGDNNKNVLPQIEIVDKEGVTSWQPTQEDMMACDWVLVKIEPKPVTCPEGTMLSFDLKIGTSQYPNGTDTDQDWGYLTQGVDISSGESTFGTLTNLQNSLNIGNILTFILVETPVGTFDKLLLRVDTQNQPNLGSKNLEVTVNGSAYNLGSDTGSTTSFGYNSDGAKQLGDLLKQNVGKTLSFCLNWK